MNNIDWGLQIGGFLVILVAVAGIVAVSYGIVSLLRLLVRRALPLIALGNENLGHSDDIEKRAPLPQ